MIRRSASRSINVDKPDQPGAVDPGGLSIKRHLKLCKKPVSANDN